MAVAATKEAMGYLRNIKTGTIVKSDVNVFPKSDYEEYTPPKYLKKISGPNEGKLFPWTYHMSLRHDMAPFYDDERDATEKRLQTATRTATPVEREKERPERESDAIPEAQAGDEKALKSSNAILPFPKHNPDAIEEGMGRMEKAKDENPGILDGMAKEAGVDRHTIIVRTFATLMPEDFNVRGVPKLGSLREKLDESVSLAEMMTGWKTFKEQEPPKEA